MNETTILIVDDHPMLRKGLRHLIEQEEGLAVIGEAGDGKEAIDLVRKLKPAIVIMDIHMPNLNGIDATRYILSESPDISILALSIHSGRRFVEEMLKAGAAGYLLKESAPEELIKAIHSLENGNGYLSADITDIVFSSFRKGYENGAPLSKEVPAELIISTKLHRPNTAGKLVHRPQLIRQLEEGLKNRLILVSAPAGYGKTTLVSDWVGQCSLPNAWLSLDKNDQDLRQFLHYLISAIRTIFPESCQQLQLLVEAANLPPISIIAGTFISDLELHPEPFIVVLDDIHLVQEKSVHDLLSQLLKQQFKSLHLVLVGRQDPFLPLLSLRAGNEITEIRMQDLCFSVQETTTFLEQALDMAIDQDTAEIWTERTEGWVSGLQLATYTIRHCDAADKSAIDNPWDSQYVKQYLFTEVLDSQQPVIRQYLETISILDRFSAPLCEELWSFASDGQNVQSGWDIIRDLYKKNLFVIQLDAENIWFRYHHLFQHLLRAQLQRRCNAQQISALHSKASQWFAKAGFFEEAIRHAIAAADYAAAIEVVESNRQNLLGADNWYVLEKWLALFPENIISESAVLLISRVWCVYHHFHIHAIPALIQAVEVLVDGQSDLEPLRGEISFFRGYLSYFENQGARSLDYLEKALKWVPENYYEIRGQTEILYGLAQQSQGHGELAVRSLESILAKNPFMNNVRKTRLLATLVYIHLISGDLDRASLANHQLYGFSTQKSFQYAAAWSTYLFGLIHYYRHELDEAIDQFHRALESRHILHTRAVFDAMAGLVYAYQAKHETACAEAALQNFVKFGESSNDPNVSTIVCACQTRLTAMQGSVGPFGCWLTQKPSATVNLVWWLENPSISRCRGLLAEGSLNSLRKAHRQLQELLDINRQNHNALQMISILILLASACDKLGQLDQALFMLQEAVTLSGPGKIMQPFIELGSSLSKLLKLLMEQGKATELCDRILNALNEPRPDVLLSGEEAKTISTVEIDSTSWREILTNREYEILLLLSKRLRDKEIAQRLFVSKETVKSHLKKLYKKLEATDRRDVVVKAVELKIIKNI